MTQVPIAKNKSESRHQYDSESLSHINIGCQEANIMNFQKIEFYMMKCKIKQFQIMEIGYVSAVLYTNGNHISVKHQLWSAFLNVLA